MKRTIKLRPQEPDAPERKVRLRLPGRLAAELEEYRDLYARTHRHEIELAALIEGILEQFLASDRFFQRRPSGGAMPPPSPTPNRSWSVCSRCCVRPWELAKEKRFASTEAAFRAHCSGTR